MRCAWCHNPEMIPIEPEILWFKDKCINCGECFSICGFCHDRVNSGQLDKNFCAGCIDCADSCPAGAIQLSGRKMEVTEIMAELLADREFYRSEGGVTFSGGEPLLQLDCITELLKSCRKHGLHTAVETNLNYEWSVLHPILEYIDLIMFDLKSMDSRVHRKYTGTGNEMILENIRNIGTPGKTLLARTPLISGVNDTAKNIGASAELLAQLDNLLYYELLPYHSLGTNKYLAAGLKEPNFQAPEPAHVEKLKEEAEKYGIKVRIRT